MSKSRSIPEELIKIKARKIREQRLCEGRDNISETDLEKARQYLEKHWRKVFLWKFGKLLLVGVVLVFVVGPVVAFWRISPSNFNRAKNTVINTVKNVDWGFGKSTTKEESIERKTKISPIEKYTETTKYQSGKTVWDWLDLLAVPILLAIIGYLFEQRNKREEARLEREREEQARLQRDIAQDNLAEEAIQKYLDDIAKLLLNEEYRKELFPIQEQESILFLRICLFKLAVKSGLPSLIRYVSSIVEYSQENVEELFPSKDNPVRDVARTQTITILRRLEGDTDRQNRIINFLRDAELYEFILKNANLLKINLSRAILWFAELQEAHLRSAELQGAHLSDAELQGAELWRAKLQGAELWRAKLQGAKLWRAKLQRAYLGYAKLQRAYLGYAKLQRADLRYAKLQETNLRSAELQEAHLSDAELQGADLRYAKLQGAKLGYAKLQGADLRYAKLQGANLQKANLLRAENLTPKQIKSACFWDKAIYKGEWNDEKEAYVAIEPDNTNFIEELKQDKSSDPKEKPDCSYWSK